MLYDFFNEGRVEQYRKRHPSHDENIIINEQNQSGAATVPEQPTLEIGYNLEIMNYGWSDFLHSFNFEHNLSDIQCAVLILWGEQEWLFPRAHIDHLHQHIKGAKLKTYQNCT